MATNRFTRGSTTQISAALAAGTILEGTPVYDETLNQLSVARSATPNTPATYLKPQANQDYVDSTRGRVLSRANFGVHIDTRSQSNWHTELGYGSYRVWDTGCHWRQIETSKGVYDWTRLDAIMATAAANNLDVLFTLGQAPDFATATPGSGSYNPNPLTNIQDWRDFLTAIGTRNRDLYGGRIKAWEIWNEPNLTGFWNGTPAQLVTYTQEARTVLKAIDPACLIVSPSPTGDQGGNGSAYLDLLLAAGLLSSVDVLACHLYQNGEPEDVLPLVTSYREVMARYGAANLPLWNTEWSWHTYTRLEDGIQVINPSVSGLMSTAQAVAYMMRSLLCMIAAGVDRMFLYDLPSSGFSALQLFNGSGLLDAGTAYQQLVTQLTGSRVGEFSIGADGVYSLTFVRGGDRIAYLWSRDRVRRRVLGSGGAALAARAQRGVAAEAAIAGDAAAVTDTPLLVKRPLGSDTPLPANELSAPLSGRSLLRNGEFRRRNGAGEPVVGLVPTGTLSITDYAGAALPWPLGAKPVTFMASAQYAQGKWALTDELIPGETYTVEVEYSLPTSQASEWQIGLEGDGGSVITSWYRALAATAAGEVVTFSRQFKVPTFYSHQPNVRFLITNTKASGWNPVHLGRVRFVHNMAVQPAREPFQTRFLSAAPPAGGTYSVDDQVWYVGAAAGNAPLRCTVAGTLDASPTATGSLTLGSNILTTAAPDVLEARQVIKVAGSAATYTVRNKLSPTTYQLSVNADATVVGAAITYQPPTFTALINLGLPTIIDNTKNATLNPVDFVAGQMTVGLFQTANAGSANGFPDAFGGALYTFRPTATVGEGSAIRQEFIVSASNRRYVRQGTSNGAGWTTWERQLSGPNRVSATLDYPSIAPGASSSLTVAVVGARSGDNVIANPFTELENGLLVKPPYVSANDVVTITLYNMTAAAIDPASRSWTVRVINQ